MSDVIVTIPGATDLVTQEGAPSSVIVYFPASNSVVTTVIDRGVLYGIQGAQGPQGPTGATGPQGPKGDTGAGVATGGTAGQVLQKSSSVDYATEWHTLVKADVGLGNVDNTSDANKPISTAVGLALADKADKATTLTVNGTAYDLSANRSWSVGDLVSTGSYSNPSWLTALAWGKIAGTPTTIAGYGITDGVSTGGSYANPTWLTSLAWGKITSTPTTLSGYGITDGVSTSGSYSNPSWITDLAFSKITGYSVPTLAQVTTAGATTTNAITVGGLKVATNLIYADTVNSRIGIGTLTPTTTLDIRTPGLAYVTIGGTDGRTISAYTNSGADAVLNFGSANFGGFIYGSNIYDSNTNTQSIRLSSTTIGLWTASTERIRIANNGNVLIGTFTDAGFRLDVNGTARVQGNMSVVFTGGYNISMTNTGIDMNVSSARIYSSAGASLSYFNGTSVVAALTWNNSGNILINAGNDNSAILNVGSTTKGFLPPRMTTTQKNAITSPTSGLVVYDTTLGKLCVRGASAWETITSL